MSRLSKAALITFVVATLAGSCLHFVYALWPNGLTALLAPVNESLWEHVKILYWPCLLSGILLVRREPESLGAAPSPCSSRLRSCWAWVTSIMWCWRVIPSFLTWPSMCW